jgi:hypothetical protein
VNVIIKDPLSRCEESAVYNEELVSSVMKEVAEARQRSQEDLRGMFGAEAHVDEVAVMFTSPGDLRNFVEAAVRVPGVVLFNTAHDSVSTEPIPGHYDVHYWFLSMPETEGENPWRLEVMYAHPGSPLHDSLRRQMTKETPLMLVHASFKCPDEEAYALAVHTLARNGYELLQRCNSTYGRFSYWLSDVESADTLLKPRVNLRDTKEEDGDLS